MGSYEGRRRTDTQNDWVPMMGNGEQTDWVPMQMGSRLQAPGQPERRCCFHRGRSVAVLCECTIQLNRFPAVCLGGGGAGLCIICDLYLYKL